MGGGQDNTVRYQDEISKGLSYLVGPMQELNLFRANHVHNRASSQTKIFHSLSGDFFGFFFDLCYRFCNGCYARSS